MFIISIRWWSLLAFKDKENVYSFTLKLCRKNSHDTYHVVKKFKTKDNSNLEIGYQVDPLIACRMRSIMCYSFPWSNGLWTLSITAAGVFENTSPPAYFSCTPPPKVWKAPFVGTSCCAKNRTWAFEVLSFPRKTSLLLEPKDVQNSSNFFQLYSSQFYFAAFFFFFFCWCIFRTLHEMINPSHLFNIHETQEAL